MASAMPTQVAEVALEREAASSVAPPPRRVAARSEAGTARSWSRYARIPRLAQLLAQTERRRWRSRSPRRARHAPCGRRRAASSAESVANRAAHRPRQVERLGRRSAMQRRPTALEIGDDAERLQGPSDDLRVARWLRPIASGLRRHPRRRRCRRPGRSERSPTIHRARCRATDRRPEIDSSSAAKHAADIGRPGPEQPSRPRDRGRSRRRRSASAGSVEAEVEGSSRGWLARRGPARMRSTWRASFAPAIGGERRRPSPGAATRSGRLVAGLRSRSRPNWRSGSRSRNRSAAVSASSLEHGLLDERPDELRDVRGVQAVAGTDRLGRVELEPAGEHRQARPQQSLGLAQELVAPVDRALERLLPRRRRCGRRCRARRAGPRVRDRARRGRGR